MYFLLPRKRCEQIVPEILRLKLTNRQKLQEHRLHIFKKMMKRNKIGKLNEVLQHLIEFDKSEAIIPHGRASKKLYEDVFNLRDFDLYGRQMPKLVVSDATQNEMKRMAEEMGVVYTQENTGAEAEIHKIDIFGDRTADLKRPPLMTAPWKVGLADVTNPPVGFSKNPTQPVRSEGNEAFYSYDGTWEHGRMHGFGKYLYDDKHAYVGEMKNGYADGEGVAEYPGGVSYSGSWRKGRYEGYGKMQSSGGSMYEGQLISGRRHGRGLLRLPCGVEYEGEFIDGRFHGRGCMRSPLSKWSFEGEFSQGSIRGSGTLISPQGDRIVRFVPPVHNVEILLPELVKNYLDEMEQAELRERNYRDELFAAARGDMLKRYVERARSALMEERTREKREAKLEAQRKLKEQMQRLNEARLKALAGE